MFKTDIEITLLRECLPTIQNTIIQRLKVIPFHEDTNRTMSLCPVVNPENHDALTWLYFKKKKNYNPHTTQPNYQRMKKIYHKITGR